MCSCTIQCFTCPETWHHIYGLSSRLKVDMGCWWLPSGEKHITQLSDMSSFLLLQLVSYPVLMFLYIFTYEWFGFWNVCVWGTVCPFSCLFLSSFPFLAFFARLPFAFLCLLFLASLPFLFLSSSLNFLSFSFPLLLMFCPFPFLFFSLFCHFFPQVQNHSTLQKWYPFWEQGKTKKKCLTYFANGSYEER